MYGKKFNDFENERMKRPERELYMPPAFRSSFNKDCKYYRASEVANRQPDSLGNCNSSQGISTDIVRRVQFDCSNSSFNPRIVSDKSSKDDDSSDFEESSSASNELMDDQEVMGIMGTNENQSCHHRNEGVGNPRKNDHDIQTTTKSRANTFLNSQSKETKYDRGLFFNYDDNLSDIEAFDGNLTKGRILTSTPNSDIDDQKVLDAAKYEPEEGSGLESTLLGQSDIRETTINSNRNNCDFEIYHDPSSITSQPTDFSEIFGNNFIPPPVPPPSLVSRLPPIHRLPSPVLSSHGLSVLRHASPKNMPQMHAQLRYPRLLFSPSLQSRSSLQSPSPFNPSNPSRLPYVSRYVLSPSLRMPSPIPPLHSPEERFNPPDSPQGASDSLYLHQRRPSSRSLEAYKEDESFYIPPPVPPPQQIRNLKQRENVQGRQPNSILIVNKILYDDRVWPHS